MAEAAPLAEVGTVTARVSVRPETGSELPANSDWGVVVCTAPVDEALDDTLDVVSLRVGQLRFWADYEVVSPLIVNEQSMTTEVCGDFPGVTDCTSSLGAQPAEDRKN